jgi:hypothetical protein
MAAIRRESKRIDFLIGQLPTSNWVCLLVFEFTDLFTRSAEFPFDPPFFTFTEAVLFRHESGIFLSLSYTMSDPSM